MKFPYFTLFGATTDREKTEPESICDKSQQHWNSKRVLLISLHSPGDQLQIVAIPPVAD
jgi:hypothetical protein